MMNKFDHEIAEAIKRSTDQAAEEKDAVWRKIDAQLEDYHMTSRYKQKQKRPSAAGWVVAAAAAVVVIFIAFTPVGEAAVDQIKRMFAPQVEMETQVEGEAESSTQDIHIGPTPAPQSDETGAPAETDPEAPVMSYVLYVDESRYTSQTADGIDRIVPIDYPEDYPEVSVEIKQVVNQRPEELEPQIKNELSQAYFSVEDWETVDYPMDALRLMALDADLNADKGSEHAISWDSGVVRVYLVDNTAGGTFVITAKFFVEAEEGHGARIDQMLESFTVIDTQSE